MTGILMAVGFLALFTLLAYNRFILLGKLADKTFAGFEAMAPKRYDLIPGLVAVVQQHLKHERTTITELTVLLSSAASEGLTANQKVETDNKISRLLSQIISSAEEQPELNDSQDFLQQKSAIHNTDQQLNTHRQAYNEAATAYNNAIQLFPSNVFALVFAFKMKKLFVI